MSKHIHRSHNASVLLYHLVCPVKYRRAVCSAEVDTALQDVCLEIASRYDITFLEIGTDRNHVHFLVQTIPAYSPSKLVRIIKSLTAREVFQRVPVQTPRFISHRRMHSLFHPSRPMAACGFDLVDQGVGWAEMVTARARGCRATPELS